MNQLLKDVNFAEGYVEVHMMTLEKCGLIIDHYKEMVETLNGNFTQDEAELLKYTFEQLLEIHGSISKTIQKYQTYLNSPEMAEQLDAFLRSEGPPDPKEIFAWCEEQINDILKMEELNIEFIDDARILLSKISNDITSELEKEIEQ